LKPERWGSLLVQEKYREEKACDKRHPYRIIIIIIIIACKWAVTQWQWLLCMYINIKKEGEYERTLSSAFLSKLHQLKTNK
jgi:hypothetical protein